jgi:hypothetical protein
MSVIAAGLGGCAASHDASPAFEVPPGRYAEAFEIARDVLVSYRFELQRVDAAGGVISTDPKTTAGLATPWDAEQGRLYQEFEDLGNRQRRVARITFEPAAPVQPSADLRDAPGALTGLVQVYTERTRRPGWRIETTSVRYSSFSRDEELVRRGMFPQYTVPTTRDPDLSARIAERIRRRLGAESKPAQTQVSETTASPG